QQPGAWDSDRSSITKCTAGSDKLSHETKRKLLEFFPSIDGVYDVYGCTEASPCITILKAAESHRTHGSVGRALPFLQAAVMDEGGALLETGAVGELVCKGPNVMQGYHNQPEETAQAIRDGWLHTGDLACMDEEGFFYIVDRKKEMIVSGGENIYPRELEELLFVHPAVADAAVVGEPDELWGETVKAAVVLKQGARLSEQEVIDYCRAHLASYKKPRKVVFLSELPRNASGKVMKGKLRGNG
ncbi:MAG: AMP-binding protein, partial [Pseudomonadota bacterium]